MLKKIISTLFLCALIVSFCGCSNSINNSEELNKEDIIIVDQSDVELNDEPASDDLESFTTPEPSLIPQSSIVPTTSPSSTPITHKHDYKLTNTVEAQIGVAGSNTYTCSCGDSYEERIAPLPVPTPPPHEHSYHLTNTVDAQVGVAGSKTYTCGCGESYSETIPALPDPTPEVSYGGWHQSDYASQVFNKINEVRVNNGLSELPWNDGDTWLADIRAEELVNEVATNTVHAGIKNYDRYVGEIAACGYGPGDVVDAWMQSSGHANQILADYNTSMAVGVYYDEYTASNYYIVIFR